MQGQQAF
ncbi:hypothetical protein HaLaN_05749, partial [Haematococcus lacustris]